MARENLWYAAHAVEELQPPTRDAYTRSLPSAPASTPARPADWKRAADNMYVPYDERPGINPQDDSFLEREVWDIKNTPKDKFPLLLHYHPLVIYRYQVIKQADIVLAMFLLGNEFSLEQKKRNFDYYDPLTTGDSSLSACIQSIVAAEIGYDDVARQVLHVRRADGPGRRRRQRPRRRPHRQHRRHLDGHRLRPGRHCATTGPHLLQPDPDCQGPAFQLTVRGCRLMVDIRDDAITYRLEQGDHFTFWHREEEIVLKNGQSQQRDV